jgi:tRNA(adenine34) deaminase
MMATAVDHEHFMRLALEEASRGKAEGNDAVGSVIVRDGTVIARGHNLARSTFDPTAHAETVAIRNAGAEHRTLDFSGCTLYSTFEPCPMCLGAIIASGITTIVLGGRFQPPSEQWGDYRVERLLDMISWADRVEFVTGILPDECVDIR